MRDGGEKNMSKGKEHGVYIISQCDQDGNYVAIAGGFSKAAAWKLYEAWKTEQSNNSHYWWDIPAKTDWVTIILPGEIYEQIMQFEGLR